MTFLPIVDRELRLNARKPRSYYLRMAVPVVGMLMLFGSITLSMGAGGSPAYMGRYLFWGFGGAGMLYAFLAGPLFTADCISQEKREGTLGLLLLAELKGYDVAVGKIVSSGLSSFYGLMAGIPILGMSLFWGGVLPEEFFRMSLLWGASLLFSLCLSLAVSSISLRARPAFLASLLINVVVWGGIPLLVYQFPGPSAVWIGFGWMLPSAGLAMMVTGHGSYTTNPALYWGLIQSLCFWSFLLIGLVSLCLPRMWMSAGSGPGILRGSFTRNQWSEARVKKAIRARARLLDRHPIVWLSNRLAPSKWVVAGFWSLALVVWGWGMWAMPRQPEEVLLAVYVVHGLLKFWVAWEASRRFTEDRRSGVMELLLTTPLSDRSFPGGWAFGLMQRFFPPLLVLVILDVLLLWRYGEFEVFLGTVLVMGLFAADVWTLCWVGLWRGLNAKNSAQSCIRTIGQVLVLPWILYLAVIGLGGMLFFGQSFVTDPAMLALVGTLIGYLCDFSFSTHAMLRLSHRFRIVAAGGGG